MIIFFPKEVHSFSETASGAGDPLEIHLDGSELGPKLDHLQMRRATLIPGSKDELQFLLHFSIFHPFLRSKN